MVSISENVILATLGAMLKTYQTVDYEASVPKFLSRMRFTSDIYNKCSNSRKQLC